MTGRGDGERRHGWEAYYQQHDDRAPREELTQALEAIVETHDDLSQLQALEIGAGTLVETRALLEAGFGKVIATDKSPLAEEKAAEIEYEFNDFARDIERLSFHRMANEDLATRLSPESVDLIVSYFALPFTHPDAFPQLWQALEAALKPGGVVSVTFFGDRDDWAKTLPDGQPKYPGMTHHTRSQVDAMLEGWQDVHVVEEENDDGTSDGIQKHWHIYRVQARKPLQ